MHIDYMHGEMSASRKNAEIRLLRPIGVTSAMYSLGFCFTEGGGGGKERREINWCSNFWLCGLEGREVKECRESNWGSNFWLCRIGMSF